MSLGLLVLFVNMYVRVGFFLLDGFNKFILVLLVVRAKHKLLLGRSDIWAAEPF